MARVHAGTQTDKCGWAVQTTGGQRFPLYLCSRLDNSFFSGFFCLFFFFCQAASSSSLKSLSALAERINIYFTLLLCRSGRSFHRNIFFKINLNFFYLFSYIFYLRKASYNFRRKHASSFHIQ